MVCAPFPVSAAPAAKFGLAATTAPSGMAAVAWAEDPGTGNHKIYIQNINKDCSLGLE
jgi:hypothetical protein